MVRCSRLSAFMVLLAVMHWAREGAVVAGEIPGQTRPPAQEEIRPGKGIFLVAKPGMEDRRFQGTVILLVEHGPGGSMGFVINRLMGIELSRLMPDLEIPSTEPPVFYGGPVELNGLLFLVRTDDPPEGATPVMEEVYMGKEKETLQALLREQGSRAGLRLYVGYSGWAPGQLAAELAGESWHLVEGDAHTVFEKETESIWRDLVPQDGPSPFMIQTRPGRQKKEDPGQGQEAAGLRK